MQSPKLMGEAKLSGLYARQAESLAKLKRKGQQTVNVRHVHVHDGEQAVVGDASATVLRVNPISGRTSLC